MSISLRDAPPNPRLRSRRRAPWRQWLVEIERGITAGFRSDSVFFVHLFVAALAVAAAVLLGLTATEWAVLLLGFGVTIAAELFNQILKRLETVVAAADAKSVIPLRRLGTAAVAVATLGSAAATILILGARLWQVFG